MLEMKGDEWLRIIPVTRQLEGAHDSLYGTFLNGVDSQLGRILYFLEEEIVR